MSAAFRQVLRLTAVVCGVHLVLRVVTGRGLVARAGELFGRRQREARLPPGMAGPPTDPIDEASWESFPASDPPAIGQSGTRPLPH